MGSSSNVASVSFRKGAGVWIIVFGDRLLLEGVLLPVRSMVFPLSVLTHSTSRDSLHEVAPPQGMRSLMTGNISQAN